MSGEGKYHPDPFDLTQGHGEATRTMTMEEQKRVTVIEKVFRAELTMGEASLVLGVSERQCYRIKARVKEEGVKGATTQG